KILYPGCYDYEDANVTKANFTREMNASVSGSWASKIQSNDDVIIYMINHGTFINATDAVFHFTRSGDTINEAEMKALLDNIKCKRLALFVDCCFSENFIDSLTATNRILVAAAGLNRLSWYWTMAKPQYWAGSWYFHPFWEAINNGLTIQQANIKASNYVPWGQANPVYAIQFPIVIDPSGLLSSWNPLL
ncbi:MAG: C13 family peptidase, partial [Candidatus Hodarchaeota archaeon]